jgi:hypothetical protein
VSATEPAHPRGDPGPAQPVRRLALSKAEAAASLGVSVDFFDEHVAPELRIVQRGRRRLVPLREIERWLEANAARALKRLG